MAKVKAPPGVTGLTMRLFAPGMTAVHRAGLGGLACTLRAMQDEYGADEDYPTAFEHGKPPWQVTADTITLDFGTPGNAGAYLKELFAFAFKLTGGLIDLSGQYAGGTVPQAAVLADLQQGITLTFLQHGMTRKLGAAKQQTYLTGGDDAPGVIVQFKECSEFRHQADYKSLVDEKTGRLKTAPVGVEGPLNPGAVIRHTGLGNASQMVDPPERILPLYFALVGCLPLAVNRGVAALLVPEVTDLTEFQFDRPAMTPTTATQAQIANAADGALQALVRLRAKKKTSATIPGCYAMTFRKVDWMPQQKSRVDTVHVPPGADKLLERFERALNYLPTRIVPGDDGPFRSPSVVRPLVADNLARDRKWYAGFSALMTKVDPVSKKPIRNRLSFEREGLHAMIDANEMWDRPGEENERLLVRAVHEAMRRSMRRIREETDGKDAKGPVSRATINRWERFRERLRLALAGSKREADVRFALTDLFSRAGKNPILRIRWQQVLPVLRGDWQLARDLGLLALASYAGRGPAADAKTDDKKPDAPAA